MKNNKFLDNLCLTLVYIFLFIPIIVLVIYSFNTSKLNIVFEGFTFNWYKSIFTNKTLLTALKNTLIVATISTSISTIIGTSSAYALYKYDFKFKKVINELLYIPIVIPEIVLGISLLCVYTFLKLELSIITLIISHIAFSIPFVIINVKSSLEDMNPYLEEAASDLGASKIKTLLYVVLPSLKPGIISGASLAFTLSLDDVVISYFTSGPDSTTMPLQIYSMIKTGITPSVNALITIILLVILNVLMLSHIRKMRKLVK